jgi:hypothetical protein
VLAISSITKDNMDFFALGMRGNERADKFANTGGKPYRECCLSIEVDEVWGIRDI